MQNAIVISAPLLAGWLLDMLFGSPGWFPSVANLVQGFIESLFAVAQGAFPSTPGGRRKAGSAAAALAPVVCLLAAALALAVAYRLRPAFWLALETLFCWQVIGAHALGDSGRQVYGLLSSRGEHGDLSRARLALSKMTDGDVSSLNSGELAESTALALRRGACERAAAPMFFLALAGGAAGIFFCAASCLRSLALTEGEDASLSPLRLHKLCCFIPAGIVSLLMPPASLLAGRRSGAGGPGFDLERIPKEVKLLNIMSALCAILLTALKISIVYVLTV